MKRELLKIIFATFLLSGFLRSGAQEFIPLWPEGRMPNSKGMQLRDSIANERIYRVGRPGMYAFFTSQQESRGAAVLICPGGGYERLAYMISGIQLAKWFNTLGMHAFVLNYRLPNSPDLINPDQGPLQDARRALRLIRAKADAWGVGRNRIGVMGTSAGGHLASLLSTAVADGASVGDSLDTEAFRPDFCILISPVIDLGAHAHAGSRRNLLGEHPTEDKVAKYSTHHQVTSATPPTFLVHAFNDRSVSVKNSLLYFEALLEKKVPSSLHIFPQGGHGIALRNNPGSTAEWIRLCELWLEETGVLEEVKNQ